MFAYALLAYLVGFALFLLGFSIFMYFENRKFGDNQFTVKLLPAPPSHEMVSTGSPPNGILESARTL